MTENSESKNNQTKKGLIIAFIILLLAINAIQFFKGSTKSKTIVSQKQTIQTQEKNITGMMAKLDSVETELIAKRKEILSLGGKVEALNALLTEVKNDKEKLRKEKTLAVANLGQYREKVEALTIQLNLSDKRIAQMTAQRDSLFKFNQNLEKAIEQKNDSIKALAFNQKELAEKVAVVAALKVESVAIDALTERGKIKEGPELRARQIYKLRISTVVSGNKLTEVDGKDIYLRIMEPDGSILFDLSTGGGMFPFEGNVIPYTLKRNILFEKKGPQRVTFTFLKGSPFKLGTYHAEIYADGFKIGEEKFVVK